MSKQESKSVSLSSLKPAQGATHNSKRVGRGPGSGRGGTSTRGHKGAKSRSGYSAKRGFEGGQMPLQRRVPKFGFTPLNRIAYKAVNLDSIQTLIDAHKVDAIDPSVLVAHGLISPKDKVKVLGRGALTAKVKISAHAFSASAKEAVEKAGGETVVI